VFEASGSPSGTGTTDQVKVITWLWQSSKQWLALLLQFLVLVDHHLVHDFFDDEQRRKSTNAAAICSEITSQKL